jgi:hypothetical protein
LKWLRKAMSTSMSTDTVPPAIICLPQRTIIHLLHHHILCRLMSHQPNSIYLRHSIGMKAILMKKLCIHLKKPIA